MFRIKICGITNVADAIAAVDAGADAIGLNFYEKSPRCVSVFVARRISDATCDADSRVGLVYPTGVFVNHTAEEVCRIVYVARLIIAQLHGDEPPSMIGELHGKLHDIPVVRVHRLERVDFEAIANDLKACREAAATARFEIVSPCGVLVDAASAGVYGGAGKTLPWQELADHHQWLGDTPLVLAGGLTPENVFEAIRIVRPAAVDVASGVEFSTGKKDPVKVRDFVAAARAAFDSIQGERGA